MENIETLLASLRHPDPSVRADARNGLRAIGARTGPTMYLLSELPRAVDEVQHALRQLGAQVVEPLAEALRDEDIDVSYGAVWLLAHIGEPAAGALVATLRDPGEQARWQAVLALQLMKSPEAVEPVMAVLQDQDSGVREAAAAVLKDIADARAVDPLIVALHDENVGTRNFAEWALVRIGAPAVEPLCCVLRHQDRNIRIHADYALRDIGAPAVEALSALLRDPDSGMRVRAANILGEVKDRRDLSPIIQALQDPDEDVRWAAVAALGNLGDSRAIQPLGYRLDHPDSKVRVRAAEALRSIAHAVDWETHLVVQEIRDLLRYFNPTIRRCAVAALGAMSASSVEPLMAALNDADEGVREAAAAALKEIGAPAVGPLVAALNHPNAAMRERAFEILAEIGKPAVDLLVAGLSERVQWAAVDLLGKVGDERAVEPLIAALRHPDIGVRLSAAHGLGNIGDGRALPELERVAREDWGEIAGVARQAIEQIRQRMNASSA